MQIEKIHELELATSDDAAIGLLLEEAFGADDGFEGRSFYKQRHHLRLLARDADQIIGHIALNFRVIRVADELIPIIGVAEVATAPAHGGKGVASALLAETIKVAAGTQAMFILLFGDHPVYEKRGFLPVGNMLRYTKIEVGRSEEVMQQPTKSLKVMALGERLWDHTAEVDLLGHLF